MSTRFIWKRVFNLDAIGFSRLDLCQLAFCNSSTMSQLIYMAAVQFSNTVAGITPADVPVFVIAQNVDGFLGLELHLAMNHEFDLASDYTCLQWLPSQMRWAPFECLWCSNHLHRVWFKWLQLCYKECAIQGNGRAFRLHGQFLRCLYFVHGLHINLRTWLPSY